MEKQEVYFSKDLQELFSVKNFVIGIIVPVVIGVVFMEGNLILNILIILGIIFSLIIIFFFLKWLFIYRKDNKDKKQSPKRRYPFASVKREEEPFKHIGDLINKL